MYESYEKGFINNCLAAHREFQFTIQQISDYLTGVKKGEMDF